MTRRFAATALDDQLVAELLDLARRAPSAGFSQGVHFLALSGEAVTTFWRVTGGDEWFAEGVRAAPVIVIPLADPESYTSRYSEHDKSGHGLEVAANWEVPFWLTDAAMAAQNLLLLAEDRRLGALYFGIFRNARLMLDHFGVPPHVLQVGAVALGRRAGDDAPSGSATTRPRRARPEVVHHQHW
jgi:nitroreductase